METNYYEAYNQPNVELVDLLTTPIERVTEDSIVTTAEEFKCDILVYATGFSASKPNHSSTMTVESNLSSHRILRSHRLPRY